MKTPTPPRRFRHRALAVDYIRNRLVRESYPRTQMALIVALTGGFGLLASFTMLHLGVDSMALRYPIALGCAYLFFLFLIWLWLRTTPDDYLVDAGFSGGPTGTVSSEAPPAFTSGGGGDFGGGGASGAFDGPTSVTGRSPAPVSAEATEPASKATLSFPDADADELTIPLAVIALSATIAVASVYVVSIAPLLFAEVLVDGALSYALFHRLRREQEQRHWLRSALRRTLLPFLATAVFLAAAGAAMQIHAPGARSIGQVMAH
jgi:hypothetical protein